MRAAPRIAPVLVAVLGFFLVFGAAGAAAAERVTVKAAVHDGFGRMVLAWPAPVAFEAAIEKAALRLRFARPMTADLAPIARALGAYLRDVRLDEDGRVLVARLAGDFRLRSFRAEKSIVIDLIGRPGAAAAASATDTATDTTMAAPTTAPPPRVSLRVGEHPGFTRLVFDWGRVVGYSVGRKGDRATLRFDRPGRIDLGRLRADPPPRLPGGVTLIDGDTPTLRLGLAPGAELRHFRAEKTKVVLDIITAPTAAAKTAAEPTTDTVAKAEPAMAVSPAPPPVKPRPTSTATAPPPPAVAPATTAPAMARDETPPPGDPPPAVAPSPPEPPAAAPTGDAAAIADAAPTPPPLDIVPKALPAAPAAQSLATARLDGSATQISLAPPPMSVEVEADADRTIVGFNGGKLLAAAAFVRRNQLWLVFPEPFTIDIDRLRDKGAGLLYEQVMSDSRADATVLRFALRDGVGVTVRRRGLVWLVVFSPEPVPPGAVGVSAAEGAENDPRVRLTVDGVAPGGGIALVDPYDDQRLMVIPVAESGSGVAPARRFVGFSLLATAQGIVVRIDATRVAVKTDATGVDISRPAYDGMLGARAAGASPTGKKLFDLTAWRGDPEKSFINKRMELRLAAANAASVDRRRARSDFARFLFANGYFTETISVLDVLFADDTLAAEDLSLRALRGASAAMLDHADEATAELSAPALNAYDDIALWRGVLAMRVSDPATAAKEFLRSGDAWRKVVPAYRDKIGLLAAEAMFASDDLGRANTYLDKIIEAAPPPDVLARASYLRGRLLFAAGDADRAFDLWQSSAASPDRWARARTQKALVMAKLEREEIGHDEAIKSLEGLRYTWRGDDFEFNLLTTLGELYLEDKDYRKSLEAMKDAVTHFADHPGAAKVAARMTKLFSDIFLKGIADDLPTVQALTLYYEFRELTPVGAKGDAVIQALADRMVAIDLLDRGAKLLDEQVNFRLEGVEKARVGSRLAVIRLMDGKPLAALKALDQSAVGDVPEALDTQRRQLRARALADLDRTDEALAMIAGDNSLDAQRLRADFQWRAGNWRETAKATRALLAASDLKSPLDASVSRHVLRLAVALALADDRSGLDDLRKTYGPLMAGDPNQAAFEMITQGVDRQALTIRELPAAVAQVASFESFMASYRDRVRNGSLSAIN